MRGVSWKLMGNVESWVIGRVGMGEVWGGEKYEVWGCLRESSER